MAGQPQPSGKLVHIGAGAGFAGDRAGAAVPVVQALSQARAKGIPGYLIFETLAERTLALAQLDRLKDPGAGYSPNLVRLLEPVLKPCLEHGIGIVSNFGAANPLAAAKRIREMARMAGFGHAKIAVVTGDDIASRLSPQDLAKRESDGRLLQTGRPVIAANAYLGAKPIADALAEGAQIVVTGRVADPALALGPLAHEFGWNWQDWDRLAAGTLVGHLLECGPQVTGGYFADPGFKDVPRLAEIGYPIAEVSSDGGAVITKPDGTGGRVDLQTVKEQLLYEIHDPAAYLTPDVVLDITDVELHELGCDRVGVSGARGHGRPEMLKATVCFEAGLLGEAEISYAGPNATARAKLAGEILRQRMASLCPGLLIRTDIIGVCSSFGDTAGADLAASVAESEDVRLRVAARHDDPEPVRLLLAEVEALYVAGPAGGGGVRKSITPQLASASCLVERELVTPEVVLL